MRIEHCTREDLLEIHRRFAELWPSGDEAFLRRVEAAHHPMFVHEFGNTPYVSKEGGKMIAYPFRVYSQTEPTGQKLALCLHNLCHLRMVYTTLVAVIHHSIHCVRRS